jgi:flagellar motor switch protein FliM
VLILLSAEPLEGSFLLAINPAIAYPLLERLLGAGRVAAPQRDRALSPLEWNVADALTSRLLDLLAEAWAPLVPAKFKVLRRESDPLALKFDSANEPSVAVTLEVVMGDQRGTLELVFPSLAVEPHFPKMLSATGFSAPKEGGPGREEAISRRLAPAEVELGVHLPEESVRLEELGSLQAGDLLVTNHPHTGLVFVTVEGRKKFVARLGSLKDRKAVKVIAAAAESSASSRDRMSVTKPEGAGAPPAGVPEALLQLPLTASVVLASKTARMKEVLALRVGEIVEFPRRADDPLELQVSGRPVAEGSAVKIGDRFGLRVVSMKPRPSR